MVKKLQEELIANISLIPIDASKASGKRAFEIINQLKDNINDIITSGNIWGTALDYVIIADSLGDPSAKERTNNCTLKSLEEAIKKIGGKTLEELEPTQRNGRYDRELMLSSMRGHIDNITAVVVREMLDTITPLHYYAIYANIAQFLGERQIVSRVAGEDNHIHNHNNTEIEVTRATLDSPSMDVESVTVQQHIRGRQSTPSSPG